VIIGDKLLLAVANRFKSLDIKRSHILVDWVGGWRFYFLGLFPIFGYPKGPKGG